MQKITYVAICLDESGSMQSLTRPALKAVNSMIETIKKRAREEGQLAVISLIGFSDRPRVIVSPTDCQQFADLQYYRADGSTAMFDAVGLAVKTFKNYTQDTILTESSFLVMCITDGEENASLDYNSRTLKDLMERMENTDKWTFTFQVPRGSASKLVRQFGISEHNVAEWETSERGMAAAAEANSKGLDDYFIGRTQGITRSGKFYANVTTDLSNLSKSQVRRSLNDVSDQYKAITVTSAAPICEFAESRTKKKYISGSVFYMLMKPEEIQPQKEVLLIEKTSGIVYGGVGARDMIGLPDGDYAKVKPGQHGDYDIYVQSTSVNRKLVVGTKILLRV